MDTFQNRFSLEILISFFHIVISLYFPDIQVLPDHLFQKTLKWSSKGVDPQDPEHRAYLDEFLENFYSSMTSMIEKAVKKEEEDRAELMSDPIFEEILRHLSFCFSHADSFHGREEILEVIQNNLLLLQTNKTGDSQEQENSKDSTPEGFESGKSKPPFFLFGPSGCGKTSLLAKSFQMATQDPRMYSAGVEPVFIIRFLGTTADSSDIHKLLGSLCHQIFLVYQSGAATGIPEDHNELIKFFHDKALSQATFSKPLYIFLDSLDQLSPSFDAHRMNWIPRVLPPYVTLVFSTLPKELNCLENLKFRLTGVPLTLQEVSVLPSKLGLEILDFWLEKEKRTITPQQREVVAESLAKCSLPLYIRLVFNEAKTWNSSTLSSDIILPPTIHEMIDQLFARLERQHGKRLVSHALGYVSASKLGLSETELEDLLSLDDYVLEDVFQYWLPPIRRLPPLLWTRIRADIDEFLTERDSDGSLVIYWYHRQFIEVASQRYVGEHDSPTSLKLHQILAEYFAGTWSQNRKKPGKYTESQVKMFNLKEPEFLADRMVSAQPNIFPGGNFPFFPIKGDII